MRELCKILIVDDEILVRQGIKHHLNWEQYGFQIVGEASNGKEALALMKRLSPHIVITDIVMPVMDGEEFTRVLKAHDPQVEVIVLSSYGEFNYVRSTFQSGVADYILKPKLETEELLQVLQNTARKIPGLHYTERTADGGLSLDQRLERLLAGFPPEEGERFQEYFPYDTFVLLGADLSRVAGEPHSYIAGLAASLEARLKEAPFPARPRTMLADGKRLLMLVNLPREHVRQAVHAVKELAAGKAEAMPEMVWAISSGFADLNQLEEVYREEWLQLLYYRFYFPDRILMLQDELPAAREPEVFDMKRLLADLKKERYAEAFGRLRDYAARVAGNYRIPPFEFKAFLGNAIFNMTVVITETNERLKELDGMKYAYFKAIDEAEDAGEAIARLNGFLEEAEKLAAAKSQPAGDGNMRKLLEYIDEHYGEPLTLSSLSRHFHFNPSYLSSYFSAHNAEGFSEYLNKIRINKAAELLRKGELTIAEISGRVGYSDHSYFTKVFRKQTGMSPSQYRRHDYGKKD
ncbi:DNA-binding response regulator [Paenibacillus oralis]|uniref:DNA-binding response regulator n=1 Tax=Paenibacillus oralis TaxID=2490856 RepID=A0A3P3U439_9BACL|nr:response regulator transcription factor [Paenibacillus oralis]RRJ65091.1 DNA-binding response regulator [Paenibacillus oralis]